MFFSLEQDQGLEALSHVLSRQKQMALDIGDEVETQNGKLTSDSSLQCGLYLKCYFATPLTQRDTYDNKNEKLSIFLNKKK